MKLWVLLLETSDFDDGEQYKTILKVTDSEPSEEYLQRLNKRLRDGYIRSVPMELNACPPWVDNP
jgi:hypothetical protein